LSIFSGEVSSSKETEFLVATDVHWIPLNVSRQAFL